MINNSMHNKFLNNKYTKCYFSLVSSRSQLNRTSISREDKNFIYYEKHHILPKSLGGNDNMSNLVLLTPREHYLAHLLLTKMCINLDDILKMNYALNITLNTSTYKPGTSYIYETLRTKIASQLSQSMKGVAKSEEQIKKMIETKRINGTLSHTDKAKAKMKISQSNRPVQSEDTRRKRSESMKGRKQSPEHIAKLSQSRKGRVIDDEWRSKLSKAGKDRIVNDVTRQKLSESGKGRKNNQSAINGAKSKGAKRIYREDGTFYYNKSYDKPQ